MKEKPLRRSLDPGNGPYLLSLLELPTNMGQCNVKYLKVNKNVGSACVLSFLIFIQQYWWGVEGSSVERITNIPYLIAQAVKFKIAFRLHYIHVLSLRPVCRWIAGIVDVSRIKINRTMTGENEYQLAGKICPQGT